MSNVSWLPRRLPQRAGLEIVPLQSVFTPQRICCVFAAAHDSHSPVCLLPCRKRQRRSASYTAKVGDSQDIENRGSSSLLPLTGAAAPSEGALDNGALPAIPIKVAEAEHRGEMRDLPPVLRLSSAVCGSGSGIPRLRF